MPTRSAAAGFKNTERQQEGLAANGRSPKQRFKLNNRAVSTVSLVIYEISKRNTMSCGLRELLLLRYKENL